MGSPMKTSKNWGSDLESCMAQGARFEHSMPKQTPCSPATILFFAPHLEGISDAAFRQLHGAMNRCPRSKALLKREAVAYSSGSASGRVLGGILPRDLPSL